MKRHAIMRNAVIVGCLLAAVVVLTGSPAAAQTKIRFFSFHWVENPWCKALEEFQRNWNAANPGIQIVRDETTYAEKDSVFVTQSKAKAAADIGHFMLRPIPAFADQGFLLDLTPFIEKEGGASYLAQWDKDDLAACEYKGKRYCLPEELNPIVLTYNKVHFKEAGLDPNKPPTTYTGLVEYAKKLTRDGRYGIGLIGSRQEGLFMRFSPFIWGAGGEYLTADGKRSALDTPEALEGFKNYVELFTRHKVVPPGVTEQGSQEVRTQLAHGKVSMIFESSVARGIVGAINPKLNIPEEFAVAPMPVNKKKVTGASYTLSVISAFTKNPEAAWKVYKAWHDHQAMLRLFQIAGITVARKDVKNAPEVKNDKWWGVYASQTPYVKVEPLIPEWPKIGDAMITAIQEAFSGIKTPEQALKDVHQATNRALGVQ